MTITAQQVKELRQSTGVGMMECKKALVENNGDMEKAVLWLRERGLSRAQKKSGRTAADGLVEFVVSDDQKHAAIVELNCETDFAAKNTEFQNFSKKIAQLALEQKTSDLEKFKAVKMGTHTVAEELTQLIAKVGENMNLRRVQYVSCPDGMIVGYNHMAGKIGVLISLAGGDTEKMKEIGFNLALHVAATSPKYYSRDEVDSSELEQEKEIARKKLIEQGKPEAMIEKILLGQMNKFYTEVCFLEQAFIKEPKLSVTKYIQQVDSSAKATSFIRFQLGEGIEVSQKNFAEEVAEQIK